MTGLTSVNASLYYS